MMIQLIDATSFRMSKFNTCLCRESSTNVALFSTPNLTYTYVANIAAVIAPVSDSSCGTPNAQSPYSNPIRYGVHAHTFE